MGGFPSSIYMSMNWLILYLKDGVSFEGMIQMEVVTRVDKHLEQIIIILYSWTCHTAPVFLSTCMEQIFFDIVTAIDSIHPSL